MKILVLTSLLVCAPGAFAQGAPPPVPGKVDGATAKSLVTSGVRVVDVRTAEEFASGHVPGAINIPYDQLPARAAEIGPPSTPVLLYCRSGRRSGIAVESLQKVGFTKLYDMQAATAWPGTLAK
jgi:rhodanese-related sulfurtransferase